MSTFKASNGVDVLTNADGDLFLRGNGAEPDDWEFAFNPAGVKALREFFQHESDEELGRWRWPQNPYYVVMDAGLGFAKILHEPSMETNTWDRGWRDTRSLADEAGVAYFEAHPERKPWEDAQHGEVWVMRDGDGPEVVMYVDRETTTFPRFIDPIEDIGYGPKSGFTSGRRIWPEEGAS